MESLGAAIKFDHGYSRESAAVGHFLRVLTGLDSPDQRRFLRFVTGSPRLPPGGLAALQVNHGHSVEWPSGLTATKSISRHHTAS